MPIGDIMILGLIVGAFIVFSGTLAWASHAERPAKAPGVRQPAQTGPRPVRHA